MQKHPITFALEAQAFSVGGNKPLKFRNRKPIALEDVGNNWAARHHAHCKGIALNAGGKRFTTKKHKGRTNHLGSYRLMVRRPPMVFVHQSLNNRSFEFGPSAIFCEETVSTFVQSFLNGIVISKHRNNKYFCLGFRPNIS